MKKTMALCSLVLICSALLFVACKKSKNSTELKINLTDAPYDAQQVNVDIKEVNVNFNGDSTGWIKLETVAGIYDLLKLQNGVDTFLAAGTVPTGTLKELRLVLGTQNTIMVDSVVYPLSTPSSQQSGLKIKFNRNLAAGFDSLLIDFDAALSIGKDGSGNYILHPVLKLK
ncbi:MAG TPA: DUF4382 domain-containing protein [Lacibacter sp.]|jgi:hypothetical protein|nr:DUF4382 domain-containing protein [Lacibacter sp.]